MVVIKGNGKIYLAESYGNMEEISPKSFASNPENWNIMRAYYSDTDKKISKKKQRRTVMVEAINHQADALRYAEIFPSTLNEKSLLNHTYPALIEAFKPYEALCDENVHTRVVLAEGDKAFVISENGAIEEIEEIYPTIPGYDMGAVGIYYAYKDECDTISIIRKIYEGAELYRGVKCFPVVIMTTGDDEPVILYKEEL